MSSDHIRCRSALSLVRRLLPSSFILLPSSFSLRAPHRFADVVARIADHLRAVLLDRLTLHDRWADRLRLVNLLRRTNGHGRADGRCGHHGLLRRGDDRLLHRRRADRLLWRRDHHRRRRARIDRRRHRHRSQRSHGYRPVVMQPAAAMIPQPLVLLLFALDQGPAAAAARSLRYQEQGNRNQQCFSHGIASARRGGSDFC